jgi:DNA helicase-2/ATP-dependent DNA helicase PcrA
MDLGHLLRLQNKAKSQDHHLRNSLFEAFLADNDMFITAVVRKLISFEKLSANKTLVQFFEEFLEISGYRSFALAQEDRIERLSVLNSFFDEIKNIAYLHPEYSISDFITYMEDLDHYGLSPMTQPIRTQSDAVELMTAHGSKGLEFEAVYIFNATSGNWESSRDPSKLSVTISLFEKELLTKEEKKDLKLEEERRLWYVAMTRAKRYLTICATDNDDMRSKPSTFAAEIPEEQTTLLPLVDNIETISVMTTAPVPSIDWLAATRAELEQRAKKYTLSVTGLNTWLASPRQFMEKYLIRQPAGKMPSASFGTAVHAGLSFIGEYVNEHGTLPGSELWHEAV